MARIRTIKPSFWTSLTVAQLPIPVRLTFIGLWNYADDEGRGIDDGRLIKAAVWPLDRGISGATVEKHMALLSSMGLVFRYRVNGGNGRRYFQVPGWSEHQRIDKPRTSEYPPPDPGELEEASRKALGPVAEGSLLEWKGSGRERKGKERAERERNIAFDALAEATGSDPTKLTRSAARTVGVALAEIAEAETDEVAGPCPPDILAKKIRRSAVLFRQRHAEWDLTPMSLAKWWPTCQEIDDTPRRTTGPPPAVPVWEGDTPWQRQGLTWKQWQERQNGETDVGPDPAHLETGLPSGGLPSGEVESGPAPPAEGTG